MEFKTLGKCDCPTGPVVQSKAFDGAEYFHVETSNGIRCCPKLEGQEISMGPIIVYSESEKAGIESRKKSAKVLSELQEERQKSLRVLLEKRKKGEDLTLIDLNNLVDLILGLPIGKQ